jgi:hypothetical protein
MTAGEAIRQGMPNLSTEQGWECQASRSATTVTSASCSFYKY